VVCNDRQLRETSLCPGRVKRSDASQPFFATTNSRAAWCVTIGNCAKRHFARGE